MNHQPNTNQLIKWQKGQPSPNPNGRPPKFITTLKKQGFHPGDINRVILAILSLQVEKVSEIASNDEYTILERIVAKALINTLSKGNLYALESLLNRSVVKSRTENDLDSDKILRVTLNLNQDK